MSLTLLLARSTPLTLQSCCPGESSSNGCLLKHLEQAKSAAAQAAAAVSGAAADDMAAAAAKATGEAPDASGAWVCWGSLLCN